MTLQPKPQHRVVAEGFELDVHPLVTAQHFQVIEVIKPPPNNWLDKVMWALGLIGGAAILCAIFG